MVIVGWLLCFLFIYVQVFMVYTHGYDIMVLTKRRLKKVVESMITSLSFVVGLIVISLLIAHFIYLITKNVNIAGLSSGIVIIWIILSYMAIE